MSSTRRSINVQVYTDLRLIADLDRFFHSQGLHSECKFSTLLNRALGVLHQSLIIHQKMESFTSTEDALSWLESRGYTLAQIKTPRGMRQITTQLVLEDRAAEASPTAEQSLTLVELLELLPDHRAQIMQEFKDLCSAPEFRTLNEVQQKEAAMNWCTNYYNERR